MTPDEFDQWFNQQPRSPRWGWMLIALMAASLAFDVWLVRQIGKLAGWW